MKLHVKEIDIPEKSTRQWSVSWKNYQGRTQHRRLAEKNTPAGKSQVHVQCEGENVWQDIAARTSRPHTLWKPLVLQALKDAGFPDTVTLRWSQKAGCGCGCSPAFFVDNAPGRQGLDIWITISSDEVQTVNVDLFNARAQQLINDPTLPVG